MFFSLLLSVALADFPPRISSNQEDLSKVDKIFVSPGLVTLVEFPQNIVEVRIGNPHLLKAIISQVSPRELTLYFSSGASQASNLIVRSEKRVFVFDIVPSRSNHQDFVKIQGAFGNPNYRTGTSKLIGSSELSASSPRFTSKAPSGNEIKVGP